MQDSEAGVHATHTGQAEGHERLADTMKRTLDIVLAATGLLLTSPLLAATIAWIWMTDWHSPFYLATRVGRGGRPFRLLKLRSMHIHADASGVDSTSASDPRITRAGHFIRRHKLDELPQLWNVIKGDMSLVGPRPNVPRGTAVYTPAEMLLLTVRPGITDLASIVFADEGDILADKEDPDLAYEQLIRPWKSRLGLLYVECRSLALDVRLIWLTGLALVSRGRALAGVQALLSRLGADEQLRTVARRSEPLKPHPPPGATQIVTDRTVIPA